jgi:glycosyltransferase involved in cell wall biosynthesis
MILFSVVIAVRHITDFLRESIPHLQVIDYPDYEVIIITDVPEVYDFGGDARFVLLDSGGDGNPSLKRNIGAAHATGDILVFMDDDAYPTTDWLKKAAEIFADPNIYALGGPAMTPPGVSEAEKCSGYVLQSYLASGNTAYRHIPLNRRLIDDYPTVNLFVRKEAFDKVGGFGLEFWPGEDTKLCLDLVNLFGRKFLYDPVPVVYHHRRTLFEPHLKQISRYGKHRGQYARIFPQSSRIPAYFVPSLFVLGLVLGPITKIWSDELFWVYLAVLGLYLTIVGFEAAKFAIRDKSASVFCYVFFGIILTHLVYGINFINGFLVRPKLKLKAVDEKSGNYSEG